MHFNCSLSALRRTTLYLRVSFLALRTIATLSAIDFAVRVGKGNRFLLLKQFPLPSLNFWHPDVRFLGYSEGAVLR